MDDDGDDKDDTKRRTRNLSEKKRRDQFNMLVTELANLITNNSTKMDKSSILKSTISFLRNYNEITVRSRAHEVQDDWKPAFLSNEEFTYLVLEALEAFVMVFSSSGRICYASDSILSLLGHKPADLVNKSIFDLTYEMDRPSLYNLLQKKASADATEHRGQDTFKENEMIRFQIHIRRGTLNFKKDLSYELVQFYGHFRSQQDQIDDDRNLLDFEPRVLFVCIGKLHTPLLVRDVSLVDTSRNEFTSRHSLEWKFLFLDHRAPPIIGYLPFEVLGTSGYDYYHFDDLEKVVTCHEALMEKGELTSCHYRFLTKGQQWIWLQSRFYITYHQWNSKPEFVVCTHRVVSYDDVVNTKEESVDPERNSETEANPNNMNDIASDDLVPMSPSYLSKSVGDNYSNSYQPISQKATIGGIHPFSVEVLAAPLTLAKSLPTNSNQSPTNSSANSLQINITPTNLSQINLLSDNLSPVDITSPNLSPGSMSSTNSSLNMSPSNLSTSMLPINLSPTNWLPSDRSLSLYSPTNLSHFSSDLSCHMSASNISPLQDISSLEVESDSEMPSVHPSYTAVKATDDCGNTFQLVSQNTFMTSPRDEGRLAISPLPTLERSSEFDPWAPQNSISKPLPLSTPPLLDLYKFANTPITSPNISRSPSPNSRKPLSTPSICSMKTTGETTCQAHPASVKSTSACSTAGTINTAASTGASWAHAHNPYHDGGGASDTASLSEESRTGHHNSERETHERTEQSVAPHYGIGAQYLDPLMYGASVLVPPGMISTMPVLVAQDQAQIQEQLQRKHEELQELIVRQQEELRRVKEQLILARLGMLQPILNVQNPYATPEEMQNQQPMTVQLGYQNAPQPIAGYAHHVPLPSMTPQPPQPTHPPPQHATQSTHLPHPTHPPEPHQQMPQ